MVSGSGGVGQNKKRYEEKSILFMKRKVQVMTFASMEFGKMSQYAMLV